MLQQTRVNTVIPYFNRWMERFPDLKSLAEADEQEVLRMWEGLGYYSRARSLHKAARLVMDNFRGTIPHDPRTLERLPGVGAYTAGAIASIGYNERATALDGNIRRIYARLFDLALPLGTGQAEQALQQLAAENLPTGNVGDYHEALMDLGSLVCVPQQPDCSACPLQQDCLAYRKGTVDERPVILKKEPIPHYMVTAAVMLRNPDLALICQRPAKGLLAGLWEFPGGKQEEDETLEACLEREIMEELGVRIRINTKFGVYRHAYTHFRVTLHAFLCVSLDEPQAKEAQQLRWVPIASLMDYPMGKIDRQISRNLMEKGGNELP